MLNLSLAQELKNAGLDWDPQLRDFFAVPDRSMDDEIFVVNLMTVTIIRMHGRPVVAFHGVLESPLDYIDLSEAVWMPSETQLRNLLETRLVGEERPALRLTSTVDGYRCQVKWQDESLVFEGFTVDEVYGRALLHVLQHRLPE